MLDGDRLALAVPLEHELAAPVDTPWRRGAQHALRADDLERLALRREERRFELPDDLVPEPHRPVRRHVDPRVDDDLLGEHGDRVAGDDPAAADAVAADVHQRATGELGVEADVAEIREREAEDRVHRAEPADRAFPDEALELLRLRMVAVHERLGEHEPGRLGGVERLLDLLRDAGVRLLAEDVLAGGERVHRPLVVHAVRERDVDRVELVVGEQRLVGAVCLRDVMLGGVRLCPLAVPTADRDDVDELALGRAGQDLVVDLRRGEKPESHGATLTACSAG